MLQEKLTTLDPQAVLQRGYAVVRSAKGIVRSAEDVKIGDNLTIQLGQGEIEVYVNSVLNTSAQPNPEQL